MVLQSTYPTDIRVQKEANSLLDAGHDVTLLCRSVSSQGGEETRPAREDIDGVTVHRINDRAPLRRLIWQQLNFDLRFRKPVWEHALESIVSTEEIDVVHVHDLPAVKSTLVVAKKHDIPVIADFHEVYPAAMEQWRKGWSWKRKLMGNVLLKPLSRFKRLERQCVNEVDHIITISDEAKTYYLSDYDLTADDVTVVSNMVELENFDTESAETVLTEYQDDFLITYVGRFGPHRGLEVAIQSLPEILASIPNARLVLVGKAGTEAYDQKLRQMASELDVLDNITFTGWVDFEVVPAYMAASDVSFVLHTQSAHTDVAVPHKLSQYMAAGNPVIVTNRPPLKRIVTDASCGISIQYNSNEFANAIVEIASNYTLHEKASKNSKKYAIEKYNWSNEVHNLEQVIERTTSSVS